MHRMTTAAVASSIERWEITNRSTPDGVRQCLTYLYSAMRTLVGSA
jgi:hypothetical protein